MAHQVTLEVATRGRGTQDITRAIDEVVRASGIDCGLANICVQHTSASLMVTENADPDVRRDLETLFARMAPDGDPAYRHDQEGDDDMAAHARSVLTDVSLSLPVSGGRLRLGTWQGVFLWEHRSHPHRRQVVVTVIG
ncbi:MAG: secondary thiamine-phosphate synthase enzyme YjbQ [Rhodocyclaceae bacterium]|nr:secondary thiamine-phosphate synthase enzyme YjbQ [Rhodocyclaceae bacterium]